MSKYTHGSTNGYTNHGCRCDDCKAAHRERVACQRRSRQERLEEDPTLVEHGKPSTYCNWGCRCTECKAAWATDLRERRQAKKVAADAA